MKSCSVSGNPECIVSAIGKNRNCDHERLRAGLEAAAADKIRRRLEDELGCQKKHAIAVVSSIKRLGGDTESSREKRADRAKADACSTLSFHCSTTTGGPASACVVRRRLISTQGAPRVHAQASNWMVGLVSGIRGPLVGQLRPLGGL